MRGGSAEPPKASRQGSRLMNRLCQTNKHVVMRTGYERVRARGVDPVGTRGRSPARRYRHGSFLRRLSHARWCVPRPWPHTDPFDVRWQCPLWCSLAIVKKGFVRKTFYSPKRNFPLSFEGFLLQGAAFPFRFEVARCTDGTGWAGEIW